jgi:hypothetical protein
MSGELKMSDKLKEQRIREICNTAVNSCSHFHTDLSLGGKYLALRILDELDRENEKTESAT